MGSRILLDLSCETSSTSRRSDFNQPFQGDNISSQTVDSTLKQVRASIEDYVNLDGREVFIPDSAANDEEFDALANAVENGFFFPKFPGPYPEVGSPGAQRRGMAD